VARPKVRRYATQLNVWDLSVWGAPRMTLPKLRGFFPFGDEMSHDDLLHKHLQVPMSQMCKTVGHVVVSKVLVH
jgi:hypothetical protein